MSRHPWILAVVVGAFAFAACDDSADTETASNPSTTSTTIVTSTTLAPVDLAPEEIAAEFLDAYGAYDADRALAYLSEEGLASGSGHTTISWGSPEGFRMEVAMTQGRHIKQMPPRCKRQGESSAGVAVRCAFAFHGFRSDEIGRGPFTDNNWDLVVRDGKITSAVSTWAFITNGFSAQMWEPFQRWVASAHPDEVQALYPVGDPVPTEASIRLWDERLAEWAATVKAGSRMTRRGRCLPPAALLMLLLAGACSDSTSSPEAVPSSTLPARPAVEVSGPVRGGAGQATAAVQDLASRGYEEKEFFFGGTAASYVGEQRDDGVWNAREGDTAEFRSRMIVRRPEDPARFSGTVVVEWLNVTVGRDGDPSWGYGAEEIIREGHAWLGVSAQQPGVRSLTTTDPQRYGSLNHPGDRYSFDIFTQARRALTEPTGAAPLGPLEPETLIAIGLSQSAAFITSYVNGVQPLTDAFDGFLVHAPAQPSPVRADLAEPTLVFVTETDLTNYGYAFVDQPDSDAVRRWEVAGAAHADAWLIEQAGYDPGCTGRLNEGPHRQTLRAALHHLVTWAKTGKAPPVAPRIEVSAERGHAAEIERDEHGNALGGIRTPLVDVPVAALSGEPALGGAPYCVSFGSTTPFDAATLARLYPDHNTYVAAFTAATEAAVDAGFILRPEADDMIAAAEASTIGTGVG